jgi:hypothetical protein
MFLSLFAPFLPVRLGRLMTFRAVADQGYIERLAAAGEAAAKPSPQSVEGR